MSSTEAISSIGQHSIVMDSTSRVVVISQVIVRFTPIEYRLFVALLSGKVVTDVDLVQKAFGSSPDSSTCHNLARHIDRMRLKIRQFELRIHRITKYGYILLPLFDNSF